LEINLFLIFIGQISQTEIPKSDTKDRERNISFKKNIDAAAGNQIRIEIGWFLKL
jgi:hypothetical protein